jgi:prepilin-type N-terminal cleavage/methylation domain-containing protein
MARGFTLIELLVVMAIIATLMTIATPRYFAHLQRSQEAVLHETLYVVRDSIDKYYSDTGHYPDALQELVDSSYLTRLPLDPITGRNDTWVLVPPPGAGSGVWDIASGANVEGKTYAQW